MFFWRTEALDSYGQWQGIARPHGIILCIMTELQDIKLIALYINRYKNRLKTYGRETTNHRNLKM